MIRRNGEEVGAGVDLCATTRSACLPFSCVDECLPTTRFVRVKKERAEKLTRWRRTRSRRAKADRSVPSARRCRFDLVLPTEDHLNLHSFVGMFVCVG